MNIFGLLAKIAIFFEARKIKNSVVLEKVYRSPESNRLVFSINDTYSLSLLRHSNIDLFSGTSKALNSDFVNVSRFCVEPLSIFHCDVRTIKMEIPTQTSSKGFVRSWTWKMSMSFEHWKLHKLKRWKSQPMPCARPLQMSIRCDTKIVNHFQFCIALLPTPHDHIMNSTTNHLNIENHVSRLQKKWIFFCTWNDSIRRQRRYSFITCFFPFTGTRFNNIVVLAYISKLFSMYAKWNSSHAIFHFGLDMS